MEEKKLVHSIIKKKESINKKKKRRQFGHVNQKKREKSFARITYLIPCSPLVKHPILKHQY